jgi:hypothetical protein
MNELGEGSELMLAQDAEYIASDILIKTIGALSGQLHGIIVTFE